MKSKEKFVRQLSRPNALKASSDYVKDLLTSGPEGVIGKGVELGVGAMLARTVLRRLPVPFNFVAPYVVEKIIVKHGIESGREVLLKGLKWVSKMTADRPDRILQGAQL